MKKIILFFICGFVLILPKRGLAAEMTVVPTFQEINLEKNQSESEFEILIKNASESPIGVKFSVRDFGSMNESGGVAFLGESKDEIQNYSLASWLSLSNGSMIIDAKDQQKIKVKVLNKESLSPGGHYGAILCHLTNADGELKKGVNLEEVIAVLVYVNKKGGEIYKLKWSGEENDGNWWKLPTYVRVRLENSGNTHVIPRGLVLIKDSFGNEVKRGAINADSGLIMPETFRVFRVPLLAGKRVFWPGIYQLETQFRFDGKDDFEKINGRVFFVGSIGLFVIGLSLVSIIVMIWRKYR